MYKCDYDISKNTNKITAVLRAVKKLVSFYRKQVFFVVSQLS